MTKATTGREAAVTYIGRDRGGLIIFVIRQSLFRVQILWRDLESVLVSLGQKMALSDPGVL